MSLNRIHSKCRSARVWCGAVCDALGRAAGPSTPGWGLPCSPRRAAGARGLRDQSPLSTHSLRNFRSLQRPRIFKAKKWKKKCTHFLDLCSRALNAYSHKSKGTPDLVPPTLGEAICPNILLFGGYEFGIDPTPPPVR